MFGGVRVAVVSLFVTVLPIVSVHKSLSIYEFDATVIQVRGLALSNYV